MPIRRIQVRGHRLCRPELHHRDGLRERLEGAVLARPHAVECRRGPISMFSPDRARGRLRASRRSSEAGDARDPSQRRTCRERRGDRRARRLRPDLRRDALQPLRHQRTPQHGPHLLVLGWVGGSVTTPPAIALTCSLTKTPCAEEVSAASSPRPREPPRSAAERTSRDGASRQQPPRPEARCTSCRGLERAVAEQIGVRLGTHRHHHGPTSLRVILHPTPIQGKPRALDRVGGC